MRVYPFYYQVKVCFFLIKRNSCCHERSVMEYTSLPEFKNPIQRNTLKLRQTETKTRSLRRKEYIQSFKMAVMTSINYANKPKVINKQLDVCRTICAKFQQNRLSSFATNPLNDFWRPFWKKINFRPSFWIAVINVEHWNAIPLPTLSQATCTQNLKKIKAKLRAWQCMKSPDYANNLK